jgi:hypothetical protein
VSDALENCEDRGEKTQLIVDAPSGDPGRDISQLEVNCGADAGCMDVSGKKRERVECQGIPHSDLQQRGISFSPSGLSKLFARFNYINSRWCHKDCDVTFFRPVGSYSSSCAYCKKGRSSVRKDRLPELFQCPTAIADICPSDLMLKGAITNSAASFDTLDLFVESDNARDFASLLVIYGNGSIDFCFGGVDHMFTTAALVLLL